MVECLFLCLRETKPRFKHVLIISIHLKVETCYIFGKGPQILTRHPDTKLIFLHCYRTR